MTESKVETARMGVLGLLAEAGSSAAPSETTQMFRDFAARHVDCCERSCVPGHFTGSAWVVSADGERALLMHHRKLGIWVQPGGHADGDGDLAAVALREAEEETGLTGLRVEGGVFDLDRHLIPPRGQDPAHFHYDVRFVVRAGAGEAFVVNEESHALAWRPVRDIAVDPHADESVRRMAQKWLAKNRAGSD
jgi:8-oxo-dGTP pyrophosphatase MutT (NUDIX family)